MAKLKVGDVLTLRELSPATDGFTAGEKVTIEHIEDGPGELNIEISNEAGEVGYCSVGHLLEDDDEMAELKEIHDSIRYGKLEDPMEAVRAVKGATELLLIFGKPNENTDFEGGDLVEITLIDPVTVMRTGRGVGDLVHCLVAGGDGYCLVTDGTKVFAARAKQALSVKDNPVDEGRLL